MAFSLIVNGMRPSKIHVHTIYYPILRQRQKHTHQNNIHFLLQTQIYQYICKYHQYITTNCNTFNMGTEKINRIKVVLVEQGKTGKWLAGQLKKNEATVSRWCSNTSQPSLEMLMKIASILNVDARILINNGIEK